MKPQECVGANWHDIGYNDAIQGRTVWLQSRTQACAKIQLKPDTKSYLAGYKKGEKNFCTYKNGFDFGRYGNEKSEICLAPELAKPFYQGYKKGWDAYIEEQYFLERLYEVKERLYYRGIHKS